MEIITVGTQDYQLATCGDPECAHDRCWDVRFRVCDILQEAGFHLVPEECTCRPPDHVYRHMAQSLGWSSAKVDVLVATTCIPPIRSDYPA